MTKYRVTYRHGDETTWSEDFTATLALAVSLAAANPRWDPRIQTDAEDYDWQDGGYVRTSDGLTEEQRDAADEAGVR